ncbi:hypothetical protein Bbelb_363240 [Branchiostoma belcheri]|nr:hypothetical protein Bbelb_363240 [Branchiostoma belcheri]
MRLRLESHYCYLTISAENESSQKKSGFWIGEQPQPTERWPLLAARPLSEPVFGRVRPRLRDREHYGSTRLDPGAAPCHYAPSRTLQATSAELEPAKYGEFTTTPSMQFLLVSNDDDTSGGGGKRAKVTYASAETDQFYFHFLTERALDGTDRGMVAQACTPPKLRTGDLSPLR